MHITLDVYEGPLDLLLSLITKNKINIYDIPIAQLTNEYLDAIAEIDPDFHEIADFLVMAATLLEIKSAMLLPRPPAPETVDPREALKQNLLDYSRARIVAAELSKIPNTGKHFTHQGDVPLAQKLNVSPSPKTLLGGISPLALYELFVQAEARMAERKDHVRAGYGNLSRERYTVAQKIAQIILFVRREGKLRLSKLFEDCMSRLEMVITFLALLETIRRGHVQANQPGAFFDVELTTCPA